MRGGVSAVTLKWSLTGAPQEILQTTTLALHATRLLLETKSKVDMCESK